MSDKEKVELEQATTVVSAPGLAAEETIGVSTEDIVEGAEQLLRQGMRADADVVIIGAGPGGYVAAIRAAQLGGKVVLVEGRELGGTCLNRGCIPTKTLVEAMSVLRTIRKAREFGIECAEPSAQFGRIMNRVQRVVKQLRSGVEYLMKKNGIRVVQGWARLVNEHVVEIEKTDGSTEQLTARNIIIASGSCPSVIPIPGADSRGVLNSDTILELTELPHSLLIVGGGAVGVEFAQVFATFGTRVTIIEMMPRILPLGDPEISEELARVFKRERINIETDAQVTSISDSAEGKVVTYAANSDDTPHGAGKEKTASAEYVLMAVGRAPNLQRLGVEALPLKMERGRILVNDHCQTSIPSIYAIGDAIRGVGLAHWASAEGIVAAENAMGLASSMAERPIPSCVYTDPEIASVGLTEAAAVEQGREVKVGKFSLRVLGRSVAAGVREGFVKIIADAEYERILGIHIIGERATDLIGEATLALQLGVTLPELAETIHPHPTFSEAFAEAAHAARGVAIHGA